MMCERRRQLLGWLVKESPVACEPWITSHRRKSTLMLPPAWATEPTTSPAAPTWRQSGKRGCAPASSFCWMNEAGGIERNRPELCRSLRMTDAICAPTASPWKSTIAIGTGSKLGLVMSIVSWARAAEAVAAVSATPRIVRRGSIMSNLLVV